MVDGAGPICNGQNESIRDDDLTRRLSQMQGHQRIAQLKQTGDEGIRRFLIELSSVLNLHLQIWDVPEALEYAYMESQRQACIENPHRIAAVLRQSDVRIVAVNGIKKLYIRGGKHGNDSQG